MPLSARRPPRTPLRPAPQPRRRRDTEHIWHRQAYTRTRTAPPRNAWLTRDSLTHCLVPVVVVWGCPQSTPSLPGTSSARSKVTSHAAARDAPPFLLTRSQSPHSTVQACGLCRHHPHHPCPPRAPLAIPRSQPSPTKGASRRSVTTSSSLSTEASRERMWSSWRVS